MIPTPPVTDNVALYVVGALALVLISILALVMRAIIRGDLVPKRTVDAMAAEKDARITEQAATIKTATTLTTEQGHTLSTQADALADFGESQSLNVRVMQALQGNLAQSEAMGGGV